MEGTQKKETNKPTPMVTSVIPRKRKNNVFYIILSILLLFIILASVTFMLNKKYAKSLTQTSDNTIKPTTTSSLSTPTAIFLSSSLPMFRFTKLDTSSWKTYFLQCAGYTIKAPSNLTVSLGTKYPACANNYDGYASEDFQASYPINHTEKTAYFGAPAQLDILLPLPLNNKRAVAFVDQPLRQGFKQFAKQVSLNYQPTLQPGIKTTAYQSTIGGKPAIVLQNISSQIAPPDTRSGEAQSWCPNCTSEQVYIDLGNNTILQIYARWESSVSQISNEFNTLISTIVFSH